MIEEKPSLQAIDFSRSDGEFIFREQHYQIKGYLEKYFFKKSSDKRFEFIYSFTYSPQAEQICQQQDSLQAVEGVSQRIADIGGISRCVEYRDTIVCFTYYGWGDYYSLKNECWEAFHWKAPKNMQLDGLLEIPNNFFINQAQTVVQKEISFIEGDAEFQLYRNNPKNQPTEFVCGSQSEIENLTKMAAFALSEFVCLFEQYSKLQISYESENDYGHGGCSGIEPSHTPHYIYNTISEQARKLFDLIFEYNLFIGLDWEYNDGIPDYTGYFPLSRTIEVEVQAPSQHERLEATLELQNWLSGKLPEAEIKSYFEGTYVLAPPNPLKKGQIDDDDLEF